MTASASLHARLGLLLTLYVCQGLPTGVFTQALPAILRRYDVPLTVIGMSGLLAMPWARVMGDFVSVRRFSEISERRTTAVFLSMATKQALAVKPLPSKTWNVSPESILRTRK